MSKPSSIPWLESPGCSLRKAALALESRAKSAFGEWLSRFPWDWYVTLTFKKDPTFYQAEKAWEGWINGLRLTLKAQERPMPYYVRVTEYQKRGVPHFHALIGGVSGIRRLLFKDLWELHGFARVLPYNPRLGAGYYLGKYLAKDAGEIRFSNTFKRLAKSRRA